MPQQRTRQRECSEMARAGRHCWANRRTRKVSHWIDEPTTTHRQRAAAGEQEPVQVVAVDAIALACNATTPQIMICTTRF